MFIRPVETAVTFNSIFSGYIKFIMITEIQTLDQELLEVSIKFSCSVLKSKYFQSSDRYVSEKEA